MEIRGSGTKGIYLVADPTMNERSLLKKIEQALQEQIVAVQILDTFPDSGYSDRLYKICAICQSKNVPVLINNRWDLLDTIPFDGVHFDCIRKDMSEIRNKVGRSFICGLTCNNDLTGVAWAYRNQFQYISFCSVFLSKTSNSCELVSFDTIRKAKEIYPLPVFLAGGIYPGNVEQLKGLEYDGLAIVSGIMEAVDPQLAIRNYLKSINA